MAYLEKHGNREDWVKWAREFVRRGLRPGREITIHGPHQYPCDYHWGEVLCQREGDPSHIWMEVKFQSRRPCRKYVVRNVVVWIEYEDVLGRPEKEILPILKSSALSSRARQWIRVAGRVLKACDENRNVKCAEGL